MIHNLRFDAIFLSLALLTSVSIGSAFAEEIPDYNNPYAPIFTDKKVYTWTDKVHITVIAPSWNANKHGIDSIGTQNGNFIKIHTGEHSIKPYKLTETDFNSGVFKGEVILTGFLHDVDGDGSFDTNPRTSGGGPTDGYLEVERDGGLSISFEFADGVVLTASAIISWHVGEIHFDKSVFLVGDVPKVRVIDPDMNLNPETLDRVKVEISSDSDMAGIVVDAIETDDDSGIFETVFFFTQTDASNGNRLFAMPEDSINAKYEDRTIPSPFSVKDDLEVQTKSKLESEIPPIQRVSIGDVFFTDSFGSPTEPAINEANQIVGSISNNQNHAQSFVYVIQVKDDLGRVMQISWIQGELTSNQSLNLSQSWVPEKAGIYDIETYVWKSLNDVIPLSPAFSGQHIVN